jgi:NitT/TauT family transport system ATP-binding protein
VLDNPLPYPRDEHHPDFVALIEKLHTLITKAVCPAEPAAAPAVGVGTLPVQPIPSVSLTSTIGLLEVLENEGSLELFELARHANLELVQLLLVVKAGEMLGWITTPGGRVDMTAEGRQFLAAEIKQRQQLLNAALRHLFVFDLVLQMLKQSSSHEVDEAAVLRQFALIFPHERPQRIMGTVVAWARYAELFRYSSIRRVFYGLQQG